MKAMKRDRNTVMGQGLSSQGSFWMATPVGKRTSSAAYAQNEFSGERGRDGLQSDAMLFDDAAQLDDGPQIEAYCVGYVLTSLSSSV